MKFVSTQNFLLILALVSGITLEGILPLRDQWHRACQALTNGEVAEALEGFETFNEWYGGEPEVKDREFRESWIRLWGLAALQAGAVKEAVSLLEQWFSENPDNASYRAFLRFQLIGAYQSLELSEKVSTHRETFLREHPELPECALIRWSWADEAIRSGDYPKANLQLRRVINDGNLPPSGNSLAKAALALVEMSRGSGEAALNLLVDAESRETRLIHFWKAVAAPSLTKKLLAASLPGKALQAASWFDMPKSLIELLDDYERKFQVQSVALDSRAIRQGIWNRHWKKQLDRLRWSLDQQAEEKAFTSSLYALRLRVLIEADKPEMAVVLGKAILESPSTSTPTLRAASFKAIIESSIALKDWKQAETYANRFLDTYPEDPALPEILFLNARAAASRKEWSGAISHMDSLLTAFPDHKSHQSWEMLYADWLLQSGNPDRALNLYSTLSDGCPVAWRMFVAFQQGRCQEALGQWQQAAGLYKTVKSDESAPANLREHALTSLLKLYLKRMDQEAFTKALQEYRSRWPDGISHLMVENLAGMFFQRIGSRSRAIATYQDVSSTSSPEAQFAREQLSLLYKESRDLDALHRHALKWIESDLIANSDMSEIPFRDSSLYQRQTEQPALPETLLLSLLDNLQSDTRTVPVGPCLGLMAQQWSYYRKFIPAKPEKPGEWVESIVRNARNRENWQAFAAFQLYSAEQLEKTGRVDSADTLRIEVLQTVEGLDLEESTDFILTRTAYKYNFPESTDRLSEFLNTYPASAHQPQAHLLLARQKRRSGEVEKALGLVEIIIRNWPDSEIYPEAVLLYSRWSLQDGKPGQALGAVEAILDMQGLPAQLTAEALLLRAEGDFQNKNTPRGFLSCLRILNLYPDIDDTCELTVALVGRQLDRLPEEERQEMESRFRESLQPRELRKLQLNEA